LLKVIQTSRLLRSGTTLRAVENLVNRAVAAAGIDVASKTSARVIAVREFVKAAGLPE